MKAVADYSGTSEWRTVAQDGIRASLAGVKPSDVKVKAVDALRQVSALIDTKAPGDAVAFKTWLRHVAQSVAEAASEGGFLGFGGVAVSDVEKATLAEISTALNVPNVPSGWRVRRLVSGSTRRHEGGAVSPTLIRAARGFEGPTQGRAAVAARQVWNTLHLFGREVCGGL